MTSPLMLLAPLAGSDPAQAIPSVPAQDPALFLAALVAALQQLQAPAPAPEVQPATVAKEADDAEAPTGDGAEAPTMANGAGPEPPAPPESAGAEQGTPTLGRLLDVTITDRTLPPESTQGARVAAATDRPEVPCSSATSDHDPPPAPAGTAAPVTAHSTRSAPIRIEGPAAVLPQPSPIELTDGPAAASPSPSKADAPVNSSADQPQAPGLPAIAPAPVAVTSRPAGAAAEEVEAESAAAARLEPSGRRRERLSDDAATTPATAAVPPLPVPAESGTLPMAAAAALPAVPSQSWNPSTEGSEAPPAPEGAVRSGAEEPVPPFAAGSDVERRAMIENSRLAGDLAEVLGPAEITEFEVTLARRSPAPRGNVEFRSGEAPRPAGLGALARAVAEQLPDAAAAPATPVRARTRPSQSHDSGAHGASGAARRVQSPPAASVAGSAVVSDGPAPPAAPRSAVAPLTVAAAATENPAPAPASPAPGSASAPSLPVSRQELPGPESTRPARRSDSSPAERADAAAASDASTAASAFSPGLSERPVRSGTEGLARAAGEARNLPDEGSAGHRPAGSSDRVTLQVADADGRQTRIRVAVLGDQIRAVIVPPDPASARQLERRMDELQAALARQGFSDSRVSVQRSGGGGHESLAGAAWTAAGESRTEMTSGREQPAGDQRQGRGQREQDRSGDGSRHFQGRHRERDPQGRRR